MKLGRVLLAGVVGGIAMFIWTSIAHMALPLGTAGVKQINNEQPILTALQASLGSEKGLYIYPGMGVPMDAPREQRNAAMQQYQSKLDANPSGILIYSPPGVKAMDFGQLGREFGFEVLEALLLAVLLSTTALSTFGSRLGFAIVVGLIAAVSTNLSYWNWFHFPTAYTLAAMTTETMKYVVAGAVAALVLGKRSGKVLGAAA
jgi:hypothetical protein